MLECIARVVTRAAALSLLISGGSIAARPYTIDDMLKTEAFGRILVAPGGRWLVYEKLTPFSASPSFDERAMDELRSRLFRVDLMHTRQAAPPVPIAPGSAAIAFGFSPRGSRLAVARLQGDRWKLGVVTLVTGDIRWFDITPDYYPYRATLGWVSEEQLVTIAQPGDTLPWKLRANRQDADDLPKAWAAARAGTVPSVTAIGSGRYIEAKPRPTPTQLVQLNVTTGATRVLAGGDLQSVTVSSDGRRIAFVEERETTRISTPEPISASTDLRRRRLSVVDLANGRRWTPCEACDVPFYPPVWSPRGHQLLFYARQNNQAWTQGRFWLADGDTSRAKLLPLGRLHPFVTEGFGDYDSVGLGWLGSKPIFFAHRGDALAPRGDWYELRRGGVRLLTGNVATPTPKLVVGDHGDAVMLAGSDGWLLGSGDARRIMSDLGVLMPLPTAIMGGSRPSGAASLLGWRGGNGYLAVRLAGSGGGSFTIEDSGDIRPQTASRESGVLVATITQPNGAARLIVARRKGWPRTIDTINRHLADVATTPPIPIRHKLPGVAAVTSWLYLPAPRADGMKPPLIAIVYAGAVYGETPPAGWGPDAGRTYNNVAALVGHGYAVMLPSMPALTASDRAPFDFAGQVLAAVNAVIARGLVDPERLGLWGHSFGGYTAATIATETNRFKAIVASNGIYDLTSFQGTFTPSTRLNPGYYQGIIQWAGWTETGQPALGATPWSDPARYVANSPIYHAGRISTPMMIIAADRDFAPLQQGEQLFSALYRQGKDAKLISYWGEEHTLVSPANVRDCYARVFDWFDSHFEESHIPPQ